MAYAPVLTTLGFVRSADQSAVLMVHRTSRSDDEQLGKFNGLGGKVEPDEDVAAAMRRELAEEAGIEVTAMRLRGTVSWPGFSADGGDVFGFVFVIDGWTGEVASENAEGPLSWQPIDRLHELPMWEGDRFFLPLVFDDAVPQFHAVLPYENGRPVGWSVSVL